jgi:hypothetical protein
VAWGVDQVDRRPADGERDDGRADGDAARPLQRQGVGLSIAGIHAADRVDDARLEQQAFGEARLTGVDVRQYPQVQTSHPAS